MQPPKLTKRTIIMLSMYISGIVLYWNSLSVQKKLEDNKSCSSTAIRKANQGVAFIGVLLIVMPLTLYVNSLKTREPDIFDTADAMSMSAFILLLGIVLISLGSTTKGASTGNCKDVGSHLVWVIGLLMILLSVGSFALDYKNKNSF